MGITISKSSLEKVSNMILIEFKQKGDLQKMTETALRYGLVDVANKLKDYN